MVFLFALLTLLMTTKTLLYTQKFNAQLVVCVCVCHWTTYTNLYLPVYTHRYTALFQTIGRRKRQKKICGIAGWFLLTHSEIENGVFVCSEMCSTVSKASNKLTAYQWIFRYWTDTNEFFSYHETVDGCAHFQCVCQCDCLKDRSVYMRKVNFWMPQQRWKWNHAIRLQRS